MYGIRERGYRDDEWMRRNTNMNYGGKKIGPEKPTQREGGQKENSVPCQERFDQNIKMKIDHLGVCMRDSVHLPSTSGAPSTQ